MINIKKFFKHKNFDQLSEKNNFYIFISDSNKLELTKEIYQLHKSNNGKLGYLYFKNIVVDKMYKFITDAKNQKYRYIDISKTGLNTSQYLNKLFIKQNENLYKFKIDNDNEKINSESNIYRSEVVLGHFSHDDDKIAISKKNANELMAQDYGALDVWRPVTIEMHDNYRQKNKVQIWQESMSRRHYDKCNEGYANVEDSSLHGILNGYGNDMDLIHQMKKNKLNYK